MEQIKANILRKTNAANEGWLADFSTDLKFQEDFYVCNEGEI